MKWTYVTVSNDGNECFVPDDDLRMFDTQRLAFNHAYTTASSEASELNLGNEWVKYGVPLDKDFDSMREVKVVRYGNDRRIVATVTSRKLRRIV
jgi:hypothetical protein